MKTKLSDLRFDTAKSIYGYSTISKSRVEEEDDDLEIDVPWMCCMCGTGNGGAAGFCDDCGHHRCKKCYEY